jgi:predicted ATPase
VRRFDILKRDSSCVLQAFRSLVLQMIATDALVWRVRVFRALGSNAAALVEVMPELGRLLGPLPPLVPLGAADTANRFNIMLMNFVGVVAI